MKVDIFNDPGININAARALEVAEVYELRDEVLALLPYTVYGPSYVRGVHSELLAGLYALANGDVDGGKHWLYEARRCAPTDTSCSCLWGGQTEHWPGCPSR